MQVVNGKEGKIIGMLRDFGLANYEARLYFTLLTIGEAKVCEATKKASVPQSKAYEVLDSLQMKGFVEQCNGERPKVYRANTLERVTKSAIRHRQRQIRELEKHQQKLYDILQAVVPIHEQYSGLRLFSPSYQRR